MVYTEPLKPEELAKEEALVSPSKYLAEEFERAARSYQNPSPKPTEKQMPLDDTDWWQGPLNKAIGRKTPEVVQKFYPKTIEETMKVASNVDQVLKETLR